MFEEVKSGREEDGLGDGEEVEGEIEPWDDAEVDEGVDVVVDCESTIDENEVVAEFDPIRNGCTTGRSPLVEELDVDDIAVPFALILTVAAATVKRKNTMANIL